MLGSTFYVNAYMGRTAEWDSVLFPLMEAFLYLNILSFKVFYVFLHCFQSA